MGSNEPKWALMTLNEHKETEMGSNESKWAEILLSILRVIDIRV